MSPLVNLDLRTLRQVWSNMEHAFVTAEARANLRFRRAIERRAFWIAKDERGNVRFFGHGTAQ